MKTLLFSLLTLTYLYAQTFTVNTLSDATDGSCSDGNCSLRDAIALSSANDTINITPTGTILLSSTVTISHTLSINGSGMNDLNISGNHLYRVFLHQGGDLNISNLGIVDGNISVTYSYGGGIYTPNQDKLTLNHIAFINNYADVSGGAISIRGTLSVTNCIFSGNTASVDSAIHSTGNTTIQYSTFIGNVTKSSNTVTLYGHSDISYSIFKSNSALNGRGGAISYYNYVSSDNIHTISNSLFHSNSTQTSDATQSNGAAIFATDVSLNIDSSLFYGNYAIGGRGTVDIYNTAEYNTSIINSTFYANNARTGAAIVSDLEAGSLQISHCTIAMNSSHYRPYPSGGISHVAGNLYIKNSIIMDNYDTDGGTVPADCYSSDTANFHSMQHNIYTQSKNCPFDASDLSTNTPQLEIIADNGGFTQTAALKKNSVLINTGTCSDNYGNPITKDQRGFQRDAKCDIGAYEYGNFGYFPAIYYLLN